MRTIIALIVIVYIMGIGVELSPAIQGKWSGTSASNLATSVTDALPDAILWPVTVFHSITGRG
jgi:hypothetical protein